MPSNSVAGLVCEISEPANAQTSSVNDYHELRSRVNRLDLSWRGYSDVPDPPTWVDEEVPAPSPYINERVDSTVVPRDLSRPGMICNTPETIYECLCYLYGVVSNCADVLGSGLIPFRVSIVYGSGSSQVDIGDNMELVHPQTNQKRKKRWWERGKDAEDQFKLPFPLYHPVKIISMRRCGSRPEFELVIDVPDNEGSSQPVTVKFSTRIGLYGRGNIIRAIRLHTVKIERPTHPQEVQSQPSSLRMPESLRSLVERGIAAGLVVTVNGHVYNKLTGEMIGTHFETQQYEDTSPTGHQPIVQGRYWIFRVTLADGQHYSFRTDQRPEYVGQGSYTAPPPPLQPPPRFRAQSNADATIERRNTYIR